MNREKIKVKILKYLDEVSGDNSSNNCLDYPIDDLLNECAVSLLRLLPTYLIPKASLSNIEGSPTPDTEDPTTGTVELPAGTIKIVEFTMVGWRRPAVVITPADVSGYRRQCNKYTRGGLAKPMAVIEGGMLRYYSLPPSAEHKVKKGVVVTTLLPEQMPEELVVALTLLVASRVLMVVNEPETGALFEQKFNEEIELLKQI